LEKLHQEGNGGEYAYCEVVGAKRDRKANEENTRRKGSHGFAGERIIKNESENASIIGVRVCRSGTLVLLKCRPALQPCFCRAEREPLRIGVRANHMNR
jgi:hypothetical protein